MVEVDAVEDFVEFAKFERSGGTVPQLTKTGRADQANFYVFYNSVPFLLYITIIST